MTKIYLSPPHVGPREREMLLDAFDSNWIAPLGPHVDAFEAEIAAFSGRKHAVATNSGTSALHLALRYYGVTRGDRVMTSSLTFAATANAIRYQDAEPVFIDSCPESWNMDPVLLGTALAEADKKGSLPKAVVPVDLYGQCVDYDAIAAHCDHYNIPLIVDAAESLGASYADRPAGSAGHAAIFSFNGNKIITTSGGGMLVTDDGELADKARFWATQARDPAPHYQHSELGYNYRLSNLLAAVGRAQLEGLPDKVDLRREHNDYYRTAFQHLPLTMMPEPANCRSTRWLSTLTITTEDAAADRDNVISVLTAENIECRPVWKPMHLQPLYSSCESIGGVVSQHLFETGLCLPSGSSLSSSDRDRVATAVIKALSSS